MPESLSHAKVLSLVSLPFALRDQSLLTFKYLIFNYICMYLCVYIKVYTSVNPVCYCNLACAV